MVRGVGLSCWQGPRLRQDLAALEPLPVQPRIPGPSLGFFLLASVSANVLPHRVISPLRNPGPGTRLPTMHRLTKQEQLVLCIILGLLLTGWAVKAHRTAHPPAQAVEMSEP